MHVLSPSPLIRAAHHLPAVAAGWGLLLAGTAALWHTPAGPVLRRAATGPDTGWAAAGATLAALAAVVILLAAHHRANCPRCAAPPDRLIDRARRADWALRARHAIDQPWNLAILCVCLGAALWHARLSYALVGAFLIVFGSACALHRALALACPYCVSPLLGARPAASGVSLPVEAGDARPAHSYAFRRSAHGIILMHHHHSDAACHLTLQCRTEDCERRHWSYGSETAAVAWFAEHLDTAHPRTGRIAHYIECGPCREEREDTPQPAART